MQSKRLRWSLLGIYIFGLLLGLAVLRPMAQSDAELDPAKRFAQAEALRQEGSYRLALEQYEALLRGDSLDPSMQRACELWSEDCRWREDRSRESQNDALKQLTRYIEDWPQGDPLRGEALESLGDLKQTINRWDLQQNGMAEWIEAIGFWADATDNTEARERYVTLNLKLAQAVLDQYGLLPIPKEEPFKTLKILPPPPPENDPWQADLLSWAARNALRVSEDAEDRAQARWLIGALRTRYRQQDDAWSKEGEDYLLKVVRDETSGEWREAAWRDLVQYYEGTERYVEAVAEIDRFLETYSAHPVKDTQFMQSRRTSITHASLNLDSGQDAFVPDSYIPLRLSYRNLDRCTMTLYRYTFDGLHEMLRANLDGKSFDRLSLGKPAQSVTLDTTNDGKHRFQTLEEFLDPLAPGVYRLEVQGEGTGGIVEQTATLHINRLAMMHKIDGIRAEFLVVDGESGRPAGKTQLWWLGQTRKRKAGTSNVATHETQSDATGLAQLTLPNTEQHGRAYVIFENEGTLDYTEVYTRSWRNTEQHSQQTIVHLVANRPAHRPGEAIGWKATLRDFDGKHYQLPQTGAYMVEIRDGRNQLVHEAQATLSEFGTLHGSWTAGDDVALGMLNMKITSPGGKTLGQWPLTRLEEYKLPEYRVEVTPASGPQRLGAAMSFDVHADYYFGGPVADAEVSVVVYRQPIWPDWTMPRPYPWLYAGEQRPGWSVHARSIRPWPHYSREETVMQETLRTDASGQVSFTLPELDAETLRQLEQDGIWGYQWRVEARVMDASRREVRASGSLRVARTAYAAYLTPRNHLSLPGDPVMIDLRTLDPNQRPVPSEGQMTVFRRVWNPEKLNGSGKQTGGYDDTELFTQSTSTRVKDGQGTFETTLDESGYYLLRYRSRDAFGETIEAETVIFIADAQTRQTGYRSGGVEVITDKDTYAVGETAQVLLISRRPQAALWLGVEGERGFESRAIIPEGQTTLIPVKITPAMAPSVFVNATSIFDYSTFRNERRLTIPPEDQFLDVKIIAEKESFRPGEQARLQVEVRDSDGKPVQTELALSVADSAVWAIEGDLAGDIRERFWNRTLWSSGVQTGSSYDRRLPQQWLSKDGKYQLHMRDGIVVDFDEDWGSANDMYWGGAEEMSLADSAMPVPASAVSLGESRGMAKLAMAPQKGAGMAQQEPVVRSNFAASALWLADLRTDADGHARTELTFPDSLTEWKLLGWAVDTQTRVGQTEAAPVRTHKPLMVRPQLPRFLVEGDALSLVALVDNQSATTQTVELALTFDGEQLALDNAEGAIQTLTLAPDSQLRVEWPAHALSAGEARLRFIARGIDESDAVEKSLPVYPYGAERFVVESLKIGAAAAATGHKLTFELPTERRHGSESLTLWIEPTLTRTMVGALDYLMDYPYGCVEQTLSRFVPTVITLGTLDRLGLDRPALHERAPKLTQAGLARLYDFQHASGDWGWWKDDRDNPFMSAYVMQGLALAREAGVELRPEAIERGWRYLDQTLVQIDGQHDLTAFVLYALSAWPQFNETTAIRRAHERLWEDRDALNPYTRSLFALANWQSGRSEQAHTLMRNLANGMLEDQENGTLHWGESGIHWRWSEGGVEATAMALRALLAIEPESPWIDPAMTWLVRNRRGAQWKNTRDTAMVIAALAEYVQVRGEDRPDWTATIRVNGEVFTTLSVAPGEVFDFESRVDIPAEWLVDGENTIEIEREGTGVLYASAWLGYFTEEDPIPAGGNEIYVTRQYWRTRLVETVDGTMKTEREALAPGATLAPGDRVEVELSIDARNHYEYLVLEDMKPAGLEPTEVKSGYDWQGLFVHRELRDERVAFFITRLPEGKHTLRYELRAETPGQFFALPSQMHAMYVPEIRANSASERLGIAD